MPQLAPEQLTVHEKSTLFLNYLSASETSGNGRFSCEPRTEGDFGRCGTSGEGGGGGDPGWQAWGYGSLCYLASHPLSSRALPSCLHPQPAPPFPCLRFQNLDHS